MAHLETMVRRLPQLYREGELVSAVLSLPALQIEVLDEESIAVQQAHWFDAALNLDEVVKLAALLNIAPEPWQQIGEFRAWVHAIWDALRRGAVTREAIEDFVVEYLNLYQAAAKIQAVPPITSWAKTRSTSMPAFVETPPERHYRQLPATGGVEALQQFTGPQTLSQKGLDDTFARFVLVGLPSGPESVPLIVNLTSGEGLLFMGQVLPGQRLWLTPTPDGKMAARLENQDVTAQLRSITGLTPGTPWTQAQINQPATPITLKRGDNDLWFLPVAHFDLLGLDRFLLALADLKLYQGRYDQTQFDQALFYQDPAVLLRVSWLETRPASFEIDLPGGTLLSAKKRLEAAVAERERLSASLQEAVQKLKAVGVSAVVKLRPFEEQQAQLDFLTGVLPLRLHEQGPTGADHLPDAGGLFEKTNFNNSTFR